jgi:Protein of unknown function (DUF2599)
MSNYYKNFITISLIVFSLITGTITANAEDNNLRVDTRPKEEISKLLKNIEKQDPQQLKSQKLDRKNQNDQTILESKNGDLNIDFDLKTKSVNVKNSKKGDSLIKVPNADDINTVDVVENKVIYKNSKNKVDTVVEAIDGGVRMIVNIPDSNSPSSYDFPIELQANEKLILNQDGSAAVTKPLTKEEKDRIPEKNLPEGLIIPDYSVKLFIAKPWAKDANGKELKTSYSVNDNILTQNIDLAGAVFPVVADPAYCGDVISSANWIWSQGKRTLEVYVTWCGQLIASTRGAVASETSLWFMWSELYNKTPYDWSWNWNERAYGTNKYWSMYNQYSCHVSIFTVLNTTYYGLSYHLEPERPNVGFWPTIYSGCNP